MASAIGRPRAQGPSASGLGTERDILEAAARLFCEEGFGSTSTYKIAAAARISQATMYHYFAGKHDILLALLLETVRPSVAFADQLATRREAADVRLWALCAYDARLLLSGAHNTGALYLLPEVADERFAQFAAERTRLFEVYRDLVAEVLGVDAAAAHGRASLVFGLVESVILRRRTDRPGELAGAEEAVADAALRVLGVRDARVERVRHAWTE